MSHSIVYYFNTNSSRMKYDEYREQGLMISSRAIESAHRTALQVLMKRNGQRWSDNGCDNIVKLGVAHKSNKLDIAITLLKNKAA